METGTDKVFATNTVPQWLLSDFPAIVAGGLRQPFKISLAGLKTVVPSVPVTKSSKALAPFRESTSTMM